MSAVGREKDTERSVVPLTTSSGRRLNVPARSEDQRLPQIGPTGLCSDDGERKGIDSTQLHGLRRDDERDPPARTMMKILAATLEPPPLRFMTSRTTPWLHLGKGLCDQRQIPLSVQVHRPVSWSDAHVSQRPVRGYAGCYIASLNR
jgi:hypothetical protein